MMHKHYCENDVEAVIELFDSQFSWFGAAEHEHAFGTEKVKAIFREFAGKVPKCNITDEEYETLEVSPGVYLCTGMMWIETDPSTNVYLRVHQRVSTVFRAAGERLLCCHIHISNPYIEMAPDDVGFPTRMARHTYEYLQEQIEEQKRQLASQSVKLASQAAELTSMYDTVPCAIVRLLRTPAGYRLIAHNNAVSDLTGLDGAELERVVWSEGFCGEIFDEDRPRMRAAMAKLANPGDLSDEICRVVRPDGETIHINSRNLLVSTDARGDVIQKIAFDITDRIKMEEALARISYKDALTGLYNRTRFNQVMRENQESGFEHLGVAYFDINGLKATNDRFGHGAGDELICRTASLIDSEFTRKAFRIGGDEFVVFDPESNEEEFRAGVERVRRAMEDAKIYAAAGVSWRGAPCNIKAQFEEADRLMYQAKAEFYRAKENDRRRR